MNNKKKNKKKGFTLIELLAVIVILAIVLVVTIPSVINSMNAARSNQLQNATDSVSEWLTKQHQLYTLEIGISSVDPAYMEFMESFGEYPTSYNAAVSSSKNLESCHDKSLAMLSAAGVSDPGKNIDLNGSYVWLNDNNFGVKLSAKEDGAFYVNGGINSSSSNRSESDIAYLKNYRIYGNSIQNGTPTPDNPIEIESVGDKTVNLYADGDISFTASKALVLTEKIPAGTYTVSADFWNDNSSYDYGLMFYVFESNTSSSGNMRFNKGERSNRTVTFSENVVKLIFYATGSGSTNPGVSATFKNIQFQMGITATSYEPYGYKIPITASNGVESITTNIYLNEPLRKIGDYADYIDFESGKVYRQIGEKQFVGTDESWVVGGTREDLTDRYYQYSGNDATAVSNSNQRCLCEIVGYGNIANNTANQGANIVWGRFRLRDSDLISLYPTIEEWKTYLSSNPFKIVYPLATPTEESITLPQIPLLDGDTQYVVNTSVENATFEYDNY